MELGNPAALWLLALLPVLLWVRRRVPHARMSVATLRFWTAASPVDLSPMPQRVRRDWLALLLQAAFLTLVVAALARMSLPVGSGRAAVVVDLSASMGAATGGISRLDAAKRRINQLIATLPRGVRVSVVTADITAERAGEFTASDETLTRTIGALSASDATTDLAAAIQFARGSGPSAIYVFTDTPRPSAGAALAPDVFWSAEAQPVDNVAIDAINVQTDRASENGQVLVSVTNRGLAPLTAPLSLEQNGSVLRREEITLTPGGTVNLLWPIAKTAGILTARIDAADALPADNARSVVVSARAPVRVQVAAARRFVDAALRVYPGIVRTGITGQPGAPGVVVCDGCPDLPDSTADVLFIPSSPAQAQPPAPLIAIAAEHPIARSVALDGVRVVPISIARAIEDTAVIARAGNLPVVAAYHSGGRRVVELRLDPEASDIGLEPAFPLLIANALEWLSSGNVSTVTAGETVVWAVPDGTPEDAVRGPRGESVPAVLANGTLTIAHTRSAGVYQVRINGEDRSLVVNPAAASEAQLTAAVPLDAGAAGGPLLEPFQRDLRVWFLLAALVVLGAESYRRYRVEIRRFQEHPARARRAIAAGASVAALVLLAIADVHLPGGESDLDLMFVVDRSASMAAFAGIDAPAMTAGMRPGDRAGVVVFGSDSRIERPLMPQAPAAAQTSEIRQDGTNNEAAHRIARAELSRPARGGGDRNASQRLVLITDGQQTAGDASREAAFAAVTGVRIDAVSPSGNDARTMAVTRVNVPQVVRADEPFAVTATIEGLPGAGGEVTLYREPASPVRQDVTLSAGGVASVSFLERHLNSGAYSYRVGVRPRASALGSAIPPDESPSAGAVVVVAGAPRLLYVDGVSDVMLRGLARSGFRIDRVASTALPDSVATLAAYDDVILDDVPPEQLTTAQATALAQYVEQRGGGLLVLGTPRSLDAGLPPDHPLTRILPVDLRPRSGSRSPGIALVVVLDKSGSMSDRVDGAPKIDFARQAVQRVLESLPATDAVGVIAFDTSAVPVATLRTGHEPAAVASALRATPASGATAVGPALQLAREWLSGPSAAAYSKRHVVLISDGLTSEADAGVARAAVQGQGFELSTVAIGAENGRAFLAGLSAATGGRSFALDDIRQLPALVAREAIRAAGGGTVDEPFTARPGEHPILRAAGLDGGPMPPLGGYVVGAGKPASRQVLGSHLGDPILTTWQTGLGRVGVYTADLHAEWSRSLRSWSRFGPLFEQTVRWLGRRAIDEGLLADVRASDSGVHIVVETQLPQAAASAPGADRALEVRGWIKGPEDGVRELTLNAIAPGRYEGDLTLDTAGPYVMTLAAVSADNRVDARIVRGFYWSAARERQLQGVNRTSLQALADITGGRLLEATARPFEGDRDSASIPLRPWLALAALLLFMGQLLGPVARDFARRYVRYRRGSPSAGPLQENAA